MLKIRKLSVLGAVVLACTPKLSDFAASESMGENTSDTTSGGVPGACGDGQPAAEVYCFSFHNISSVRSPKLAVSGNFTGAPPERLAAFGLGHTGAMVWWENGALLSAKALPPLTASGESQGVAVNAAGTSHPDLLFTDILTAGIAPSDGEELKPFVPIGLPDSATGSPGHTIPLDLSEDGTIEYVKGSGARAAVWRKVLDKWEMDAVDFPVPGCEVLMNFALADFDDDGRTDLAYIGEASTDGPAKCEDLAVHGIVVLLQNELAGLTMTPMISTGQHRFLRVRAGDFDADGRSDLSALTTSGDLLVFRAGGQGLFDPPHIVEGIADYAVGDVDGDGQAEIVVSKKDDQSVFVVDRIFEGVKIAELDDIKAVPLSVGDLNHDGVGDIALMSQTDDVTILTVAVSNP